MPDLTLDEGKGPLRTPVTKWTASTAEKGWNLTDKNEERKSRVLTFLLCGPLHIYRKVENDIQLRGDDNTRTHARAHSNRANVTYVRITFPQYLSAAAGSSASAWMAS